MENWTVLSGVVLAWLAQWVRGSQKIPTIASYGIIVVFGLLLYALGYEGAVDWSRKFVVDGLMWIAALLGIGRVAADIKAAPKTDANPGLVS